MATPERIQTPEELEAAVLAEVRAEAAEQNAEKSGVWNNIMKIAGNIADKVQVWQLPNGVDLERYHFLKRMYERLRSHDHRGELLVLKNSIRIADKIKKPKYGALDRLDANADIIDYLLYQYLPDEIVNDEDEFRHARQFFLEDFGIIPHLA